MKYAKFSFSLTVLCILFSVSYFLFPVSLNAQWLETTIYFPDSLSGISGPKAFTYNATNNKIYVGGEQGNCVIVIDGQTNQKIARIPAGSNIQALCWNPTNNKVYCTNHESNNVTIIDGETNSVITSVRVGRIPWALVYNRTNNKAYCANLYNNNVTIIDGASNSVVTTVTVGSIPWTLAYNPTDNKIYCANYVSNNVTIIDGETNSVITKIEVGDAPGAFTYNPQQNRVYVANYGSSSISIIIDVGVAIEEHQMLDFEHLTPEIYPNPVKGVLRVRGPLNEKTIKIFDVSGKLIKEIATTATLSHNDEVVEISLKGINPGVYFLQFGKMSATEKLIIAK